MDLDSFRDMMGILGGYYLSERMFAAIDTNGDGLIALEEYINYFDILTHGTSEEKNIFNFRTLDLSGDGKVKFDEFQTFWTNFLKLYGEALQTKLYFDEQLVKITFEKIAGNKDNFDFEDFKKAKANNPEVFEWLEQPGKYVQEFGLENNHEQKVEFYLVESFYLKVQEQLDGMKSDLEKLIGIGQSKQPYRALNTENFGRSSTRVVNKSKSNIRNNTIIEGLQNALRKT